MSKSAAVLRFSANSKLTLTSAQAAFVKYAAGALSKKS
jgi:hypothetical protein